jgi:GntR family phosphonate transport system transcriptional regulator
MQACGVRARIASHSRRVAERAGADAASPDACADVLMVYLVVKMVPPNPYATRIVIWSSRRLPVRIKISNACPAFTFPSSAAHYNANDDIQTDRNDTTMTSNETGTPGLAVERGAGVAVWRQIEQILSAEITAKSFGEEGRLPSEAELARRFDVNRHTVRRAMLRLAATGLVSVEQGRGTFVQPGAIDYQIGRRTRFTENLRRNNQSSAGVMLSSEKVKADPVTAKALGIRAGTLVYQIETRHDSEDVPLTYARSWFPAMRFTDLPDVLGSAQGVSAALAEFGVTDYTRKWSRIGCILPSSDVARRLQINRQQPVMWVESVDVDEAGVPIKYGITHFAADRVQLLVEDGV